VPSDDKVEHLKIIQGVISRMATNSFALRGWTVTLVAALFAFGAREADRAFIVVAWIPVLVFAGLDAYYLWRERLFRKLYADVAARPATTAVDFAMDVEPHKTQETWPKALGSTTILGFYGPVVFLLGGLTLYFSFFSRAPVIPAAGPKTITISIQ
jgi:hypothetical protein